MFLSSHDPRYNEIIMEDKELKKRLKKIPDVDKNGDPIYKIDNDKNESGKEKDKPIKKNNRGQELDTDNR